MKEFWILNGPNLNRLGKRNPSLYGTKSYDELVSEWHAFAGKHRVIVRCKQSNHEGDLIDWIQEADDKKINGIIVNPGAYAHTSIALSDAAADCSVPIIEVHISDIQNRDSYRKQSFMTPFCTKQIIGKGTEGYLAALAFLNEKSSDEKNRPSI